MQEVAGVQEQTSGLQDEIQLTERKILALLRQHVRTIVVSLMPRTKLHSVLIEWQTNSRVSAPQYSFKRNKEKLKGSVNLNPGVTLITTFFMNGVGKGLVGDSSATQWICRHTGEEGQGLGFRIWD
jgi:hypothetical protein